MPRRSNEEPRITKAWVGIDPGVNGGLALVSETGLVIAKKMPEGLPPIFVALEEWDKEYQLRACVEWINPAIQGAGKSAMSKLYGNYMSCRAFLTALRVPHEIPYPKDWQAAFSIEKRKKSETVTKWKDRLKAKAMELFPQLPNWTEGNLADKRAVADALLIAEYARRLTL